MSDYPEHDKMTAIADQTQAAGEFVEWLGTQGIQLLRWRTDMTDLRETAPFCKRRYARHEWVRDASECQGESSGDHCRHWEDGIGPDDEVGLDVLCCQCGQPKLREVTGIEGWVPAGSLIELLAQWQEIDQDAIEREKRAMLASIREAAKR